MHFTLTAPPSFQLIPNEPKKTRTPPPSNQNNHENPSLPLSSPPPIASPASPQHKRSLSRMRIGAAAASDAAIAATAPAGGIRAAGAGCCRGRDVGAAGGRGVLAGVSPMSAYEAAVSKGGRGACSPCGVYASQRRLAPRARAAAWRACYADVHFVQGRASRRSFCKLESGDA